MGEPTRRGRPRTRPAVRRRLTMELEYQLIREVEEAPGFISYRRAAEEGLYIWLEKQGALCRIPREEAEGDE